MSLLILVAAMLVRSSLAVQVLLAGSRDRAGVMHHATKSTVVKEFHVRFLSLAVLLLLLALVGLRFRSGRSAWFTRHHSVANGHVPEHNGVVDANGDKDPSRVLLLTEDVRVDHDQEQGDDDKAGDVAKHLAFPLPGQL